MFVNKAGLRVFNIFWSLCLVTALGVISYHLENLFKPHQDDRSVCGIDDYVVE